MKTASTILLRQQLIQSRAFSRGVAAFGCGFIAFAAAGHWANRARTESLELAIDRLNAEIELFLATGGSLAGIRGVEAALNELQARSIGIDARATFEMQSPAQADSDEVRAVWKPQVQRLVIERGGERGVRRIDLSGDQSKRVA